VIKRLTAEAASEGARIVAFLKMCVTGYWHVRNLGRAALDRLAELVPAGGSLQAVAGLAKRHGIAVGAGLIERDEAGALYNAYFVATPYG